MTSSCGMYGVIFLLVLRLFVVLLSLAGGGAVLPSSMAGRRVDGDVDRSVVAVNLSVRVNVRILPTDCFYTNKYNLGERTIWARGASWIEARL